MVFLEVSPLPRKFHPLVFPLSFLKKKHIDEDIAINATK